MLKPSAGTEADMWHLRLGHLNFQEMYELKSRALNINFERKSCFSRLVCCLKCKQCHSRIKGTKGKYPNITFVSMFLAHSHLPLKVLDIVLMTSEHQHLEPRAQLGIYVGNNKSRRGFKLVLDGKHKTVVTCSAAVYEQTLFDAIYSALQNTSDKVSTIPSNPKKFELTKGHYKVSFFLRSKLTRAQLSRLSITDCTAQIEPSTRTSQKGISTDAYLDGSQGIPNFACSE